MRKSLISAVAILLATCLPAQADLMNMVADQSNSMTTFGPSENIVVPVNGSYALESKVTSTVNSGGGPLLGSDLKIIAGTNTIEQCTVVIQWRTRTWSECFSLEGGTPTEPPVRLSQGVFGVSSDIVDISGMATDSVTGATDPFVLIMAYEEAFFDEPVEASNGCIHANWLNPTTGTWDNAIDGNIGENVGVVNFQGSWQDAGSPMALGSWGVDTVDNYVWAVINHNSQFSTQPEPATWALMLAGAAAIGRTIRRRRKNSSM